MIDRLLSGSLYHRPYHSGIRSTRHSLEGKFSRGWALGVSLVLGVSGLMGVSCRPSLPPSPFLPLADQIIDLAAAQHPLKLRARRLVVPADPLTVTLYYLDSQCDRFQPDPVQVPRANGLAATVGLMLAENPIADLTLSGYRVRVEGSTAILDLRVSRDSPRSLQSLSLCEQKALFGSLRKTLIDQPDWGIKTVQFTQRGYVLVL